MDHYSTIGEITDAMRQGKLSCLELVDASLQRIERRNGKVNAVVGTRPEAARYEAEAADLVPQEKRGPLHGIPVLIKDLNELTDLPTTYGSRALSDNVAKFEALVVSRLKAAGAIVVGKTNTPEFGLRPTTENGVYGATRNPFDPHRTAGGSSGGAAAALATGMTPIALGGDGGGSCRIPASCCGIVGMKPSRGRVPWAPIAHEYWAALATNGPMARSVEDTRTMLDAMAGPVTGEPYGVSKPSRSAADGGRPWRIGVCVTPAHGEVDDEVVDAVRATADVLRGLGHDVEDYDFDLGGLYDHWMTVVEANTAMTVEHVIGDGNLAGLEANTLALAMRGRQKSASDYAFAVHAMRNRSAEIMQAADSYDVILTPTLTYPAPPVDEDIDRLTHEERWRRYLDWLAFTYPINCTGQPAISLPGAWSRAGLPIGIQLVGRMGDDHSVLVVGAAIESARPWREKYNLTGDK
jgi:Asp-tRNA(Asn)/Glu-tRNA(Gln) amidotransferase A subunit family amidase